MTLSDFAKYNDTKRRAVSLRQLSYLCETDGVVTQSVQLCTYDEIGRRFLHGWQDIDTAGRERTLLARRLITTIEHFDVT